eukprot:14536625-Alexandrium_andersonii.AAC.1
MSALKTIRLQHAYLHTCVDQSHPLLHEMSRSRQAGAKGSVDPEAQEDFFNMVGDYFEKESDSFLFDVQAAEVDDPLPIGDGASMVVDPVWTAILKKIQTALGRLNGLKQMALR